MKHDTKLPKKIATNEVAPVSIEGLGAAKHGCAIAPADSSLGTGCGSDNRIARLEKLADSLWEWSERIFSLALKNDEGPIQTAALAREAMNLGKGYASLLETIDQRRAKLGLS